MAKIVFERDFLSLKDKITAIEHRAPDRILKAMDKEGNALRRELRDATPVGPTGNLQKRWKADRAYKEYGTYVKKIRSTAPHYRLVERGHRLVSHKPKKLFIRTVKGQRFAEKVLDDHESTIDARYEKIIDDIMGDIFG